MASALSGKAGRNSAIWAAGQLQGLEPRLLDTIQQGYEGAKGAIAGGREDISSGYGAALDYLNKMYGAGAGAFREASGALAPVQQQNMAGYGMLSNALGLGGAEGNAAARDAFQAGPGYQWQVDQATDAAQRSANKVGQLYGGNTATAVATLGSNLANQEWGNWIKNLQPYQAGAITTGGQQANVLANLAQMYGNQAGAGSGVLTGQANQQSALQQLLAELSTSNATSQANTISGIQGQIIGVGQQGMMAGQQAAQNRLGAVMGGLQLGGQALGGIAGLGIPGGGTLGGNFLKKIFSS